MLQILQKTWRLLAEGLQCFGMEFTIYMVYWAPGLLPMTNSSYSPTSLILATVLGFSVIGTVYIVVSKSIIIYINGIVCVCMSILCLSLPKSLKNYKIDLHINLQELSLHTWLKHCLICFYILQTFTMAAITMSSLQVSLLYFPSYIGAEATRLELSNIWCSTGVVKLNFL